MKLKVDFVIRNIAGECIVVPSGPGASHINGILSVTPSGELLLRRLTQECQKEDLVQLLLDNYEVTPQQALEDVEYFLSKLRAAHLI